MSNPLSWLFRFLSRQLLVDNCSPQEVWKSVSANLSRWPQRISDNQSGWVSYIWVYKCYTLNLILSICKQGGIKWGYCKGPCEPMIFMFQKGPIRTPLGHCKHKIIFCSGAPPPNPALSIWGEIIHFCLKWSKGVRMGPKRVSNVQKHLGWPFWSLLDLFGTLTSLPSLAIFGPKWTIFEPVMNRGP